MTLLERIIKTMLETPCVNPDNRDEMIKGLRSLSVTPDIFKIRIKRDEDDPGVEFPGDTRVEDLGFEIEDDDIIEIVKCDWRCN